MVLPSLPVYDMISGGNAKPRSERVRSFTFTLCVLGLVRERSGGNVESRLRMRSPLRHFPFIHVGKAELNVTFLNTP